jgi:hypothetical protein
VFNEVPLAFSSAVCSHLLTLVTRSRIFLRSSETSVHTRSSWRRIQEDGIIHKYSLIISISNSQDLVNQEITVNDSKKKKKIYPSDATATELQQQLARKDSTRKHAKEGVYEYVTCHLPNVCFHL